MNTNGFSLRLVLFLMLLTFSITALSHDVKEDIEDNEFPRLMSGYNPSYFAIVPGTSKTNTNNDTHVEFYLSIAYPIVDDSADGIVDWLYDRYAGIKRRLNPDFKPKRFNGDHQVYFVYNGQYDFFSGSRTSSPIISRRQNPGVTYKYTFDKNKPNMILKNIKLGWFHESNGQALDEESYANYDGNKADLFEEYRSFGQNPMDNISRGWDYLEVEFKASYQSYDFYFNFRDHCNCQALGRESKEDNIFWDLSKEETISKYKGTTAIFSYTWETKYKHLFRFNYILTTGERKYFAEKFTHKVSLTGIFLLDTPITLFYFNGYGENVSEYHRKTQYLAFGLEFW